VRVSTRLGSGSTYGLGLALRVRAINLPFLVVDVLAQPDEGPVTLDVRTARFMRLTPEFVAAQVGPPAKAG
jgi:hypothetical protein